MLARLWSRLDKAERKLRRSFGTDISTPAARRWSRLHYHLFDHAFLRVLWTNFFQIAPGVYRSNQPTHRRFERYAAMGIKTVVNLRGEDRFAHYLFERESLQQLGMTMVDAKLWAREAAPRKRIVGVIDALRAAEKPMMFHCKSGADRAGFVAAMYLLVFEDVPIAEAKKQLGLRYIHLDFTKTGVQDYILRVYEARLSLGEIGFEDWIRTEYAAKIIQPAWDARRPEIDCARELMGG
ncbi:tyrosine phosphatase family protein [Antarctobacter heliothermus]|uniref:Tyrosine phosphatase family protein n=1 Tax=Antarctobacter heliothermus TaxID=74033 RepID=A0A222E4Y4_9RHOB|nr:tyrosine-protein phosphatase [Antarctobacter heliothermus]ASP21279.1 tyrosine phosphatase family protein [Antarctobacter heliothermus]MBT55292.1 protein tyrosine phosphatase [Mameliella sp.]|tara:strand:- start:1163 stop:1876 length:714 start_codon:yes stop_codon:yes gene_type:complete